MVVNVQISVSRKNGEHPTPAQVREAVKAALAGKGGKVTDAVVRKARKQFVPGSVYTAVIADSNAMSA